MLFISAGLLIPWANPEADLGCRQMATSRSGCAAADASDPSYFSSMAIRGSSLLPSLIISGFSFSHFRATQLSLIFSLTLKQKTAVHAILCAERGQKLSAGN